MASKFVKEILADIKNNPNNWCQNDRIGISKEDIHLVGCYNGWLLSCCDLIIKGTIFNLTYMDRLELEKSYYKWLRKADLQIVLKDPIKGIKGSY